jgi:hypothetical protein
MLQKTTMTTMYTQSMQIVLETQLRDREHPDRGLEGGHGATHMSVGKPHRLADRMIIIRWQQRPSALRRRGWRSGPPPQPRGCRLRRPPPRSHRQQSFIKWIFLWGGGGGRKAGPVRQADHHLHPHFPAVSSASRPPTTGRHVCMSMADGQAH